MSPSSHSITQWIESLRNNEPRAQSELWQRFCERMLSVARARLANAPRRVADEEDVVLNAFDSFCRGIESGRFPDLRERNGLWQVLLSLTVNKAVDLMRHIGREKRTWRRTVSQSELENNTSDSGIPGFEAMLHSGEPDPAFASEIADHLDWLLQKLQDEQLRRIALLKLEGFTNPEIAGQVGCALSTVERRLVLIRKRLEAELRNDDSPE